MRKENNRRKYPEGRRPTPHEYAAKKAEADKRKKDYDDLSIEDRLVKLNDQLTTLRHLGKNPGVAKKQSAKLLAALEKRNNPQPEPKTEHKAESKVDDKKHMKAKDRRKAEQGVEE